MQVNCYLENGQYTVKLDGECDADNEFLCAFQRSNRDVDTELYREPCQHYPTLTLTKEM